MPDTMNKHQVTPDNAARFKDWIANRGGLALWFSANLSNPGATWTTPALTEDGQPYPRPSWQVEPKPYRIITDPADVEVCIDEEVKRFHVDVVNGDSFNFVLTDKSSKRVKDAVAKVGDGAYYRFDYDTQEAVIMRLVKKVSLAEWKEGA